MGMSNGSLNSINGLDFDNDETENYSWNTILIFIESAQKIVD